MQAWRAEEVPSFHHVELRLSGLATDFLFLQPLSSPVTEVLRAKARQSQYASLLDTNERDSGSENVFLVTMNSIFQVLTPPTELHPPLPARFEVKQEELGQESKRWG